MNSKKIIVISGVLLMFISLSSFKSKLSNDGNAFKTQEGLIVYATFDEKEDYGYNFEAKGKDGEVHTLTFQNVEDAVLKTFDLNTKTHIGTMFKITFNRDFKRYKDEDGNDDEDEINTITKLEKI